MHQPFIIKRLSSDVTGNIHQTKGHKYRNILEKLFFLYKFTQNLMPFRLEGNSGVNVEKLQNNVRGLPSVCSYKFVNTGTD